MVNLQILFIKNELQSSASHSCPEKKAMNTKKPCLLVVEIPAAFIFCFCVVGKEDSAEVLK